GSPTVPPPTSASRNSEDAAAWAAGENRMPQPGYQKISIDFHGRPLVVETGRMAKQAGGAAFVQFGETAVLVTATALATAREGIDFFPLTCDYQEKTFAAGKIPGGFFKREGRPAEKEVLTS